MQAQSCCVEVLVGQRVDGGLWWSGWCRGPDSPRVFAMGGGVVDEINVVLSHSVMSDSLRPHGLQHIRLPSHSITISWSLSNSLQPHGL